MTDILHSDTQISIGAWLISCTLIHKLVLVHDWYPALWHGLVLVQGWHFVLLYANQCCCRADVLHSGTQISVVAGLTSCTLVHKSVLLQGWHPALWYTNQCCCSLTSCTLVHKSVFYKTDILYSDTEISVGAGLTSCTLTETSCTIINNRQMLHSDPHFLHENGKV